MNIAYYDTRFNIERKKHLKTLGYNYLCILVYKWTARGSRAYFMRGLSCYVSHRMYMLFTITLALTISIKTTINYKSPML